MKPAALEACSRPLPLIASTALRPAAEADNQPIGTKEACRDQRGLSDLHPRPVLRPPDSAIRCIMSPLLATARHFEDPESHSLH